MNDARPVLGLGALAIAGVAVLGLPVGLKAAETWRPEMTWAAMLLFFGTIITVGVALCWAWRGRPVVPDADHFRIGVESLKYGQKVLDAERRAALPPAEDTWPSIPYVNVTQKER